MQDRPTYDELLAAVERFLEDGIVTAEGGGVNRYHARVAANVIRIVRRELANEDAHLERELTSLAQLLGPARGTPGVDPTRTAQRHLLRGAITAGNEELCTRIRSGEADASPFRDVVLRHVREVVRDKLRVSNPRWIEFGRHRGD